MLKTDEDNYMINQTVALRCGRFEICCRLERDEVLVLPVRFKSPKVWVLRLRNPFREAGNIALCTLVKGWLLELLVSPKATQRLR